MNYEQKAELQDSNKARMYEAKKKAIIYAEKKNKHNVLIAKIHEAKKKQMSSEKQWVECLKCDKQFEQPKNDEVCIYCNNQDRQETIYLSEEMVNDE